MITVLLFTVLLQKSRRKAREDIYFAIFLPDTLNYVQYHYIQPVKYSSEDLFDVRTVPTFVTVHTFCTSRDTRVSFGWCLRGLKMCQRKKNLASSVGI